MKEARKGRRQWDGGEEEGPPGSADHWSLTASPKWGLGSEEEDKSPISASPVEDLRRDVFPPAWTWAGARVWGNTRTLPVMRVASLRLPFGKGPQRRCLMLRTAMPPAAASTAPDHAIA